MGPSTCCHPALKKDSLSQLAWARYSRRNHCLSARCVGACVAKPEVEVQSGVFSRGIHDSEVLQCPEIRESLVAQPSPFVEDNNAGGGCAPPSQALQVDFMQAKVAA